MGHTTTPPGRPTRTRRAHYRSLCLTGEPTPTSTIPAAAQRRWWIGRIVADIYGRSIGTVLDAHTDPGSRRPTWLTVDIGSHCTADVVVAPTSGSMLVGEMVFVAHDRSVVLATPRAVIAMIAASVEGPRHLGTDEPAARS